MRGLRGQVFAFDIGLFYDKHRYEIMARPLRLSFEDAVYHITVRGHRKENIFYSERDKIVFLDKMNETFEKYSFICCAYCLMNNHYHLFIKTPLANLSEGMHYLNSSYANWFRTKYKLVGSVFQGRYKSLLVDEDNYGVVLSAYIHLNPLRAGIVKQIEEYSWSSFLSYIGAEKPVVERLDTLLILHQFGNNLKEAKKKYKDFVLNNADIENPLRHSFKGAAVGDGDFIEEVKEKIKSIGIKREIKETKFWEGYRIEDIIEGFSECFDVEKEKAFSRERGNSYRQLAIYLIKRYTSLSLKEIGNLFNVDYTTVSCASRRFREKIKKDRMSLNMLKEIVRFLGEKKCQMQRPDP